MVLPRIRRLFVRRFPRPKSKTPTRRSVHPAVEEFEARTVPACTNPPTQCFLSQAYRDVLAREIDTTGLNAWTQALNSGVSRQQVVGALTASQEYRTLVVQRAYNQFLGRGADETGLNTFTAFLATGGSVEQMQTAILASPEYSLRSDNASVPGFLRSVYRDVLGRAIDAGGESTFTLYLATGGTRGQVALILLTSLERASNLVKGYYRQFLGREADTGGLTFFVTALGSGTRQEQVISIFVGSEEYFRRL